MGKCQPAKIARSERRLLASALETCRWQIVNVITTLTQEQQVSPINLLRADEQENGEGDRGKGEARRQSRSRGCRPPASSHVPVLPGGLTAPTRTSRGGIRGRSALETQQVLGGRSTGWVVQAGFPSTLRLCER